MAKRLQRHPIGYEKDQSGCMWGFISIFDFRLGRSTRRLLSDRRHSGRQVVGAGCSRSNQHMLTISNGDSHETYDGEHRYTLMADKASTSVKELMEEEMFSEQEHKEMNSGDTQSKESDSGRRGRFKKNRKRMSITRKSSGDVHRELDAAENLGPENSCHQDSEEKASRYLDMKVVMNELCQQISLKSSSTKHGSNNGLTIQSQLAYSVFDEKLTEALKAFVDQRFRGGKHLPEDEKIKCLKELIDALQTLSSNKELILKLLEDSNSLLVKHIEDLEGAQLEKEQNSNPSARDNLLDGKLKDLKPSDPVGHKQHTFFRRKSKPVEKILLKGQENCQTSNRFVILKPGLPSSQTSETEIKLGSSLRFRHIMGSKMHAERNASQFSFTEIKRKLKLAMGKEKHGVASDDITQKDPYVHQDSRNTDKGDNGEKGGWNSPNRNHFHTERFARPAIGSKNKDKICKPKDNETSMGNETLVNPNLRLYNNLYVEAKKHLLEMLSNGDEVEEFSSSQLPKTLGRLLSLPEFNFSPICSPGGDKEHNFVMAQKRFSPRNNVHMVNKDSWLTQEHDVSLLDSPRQNINSQSCITGYPEDTLLSCNSSTDVLDELNSANAVEESLCSTRPEKNAEGHVEIVEATDESIQKENKALDDSTCSSSVSTDKQTCDLTEVCDEDGYPNCLKLDSFEQDDIPISPLTSPPSCSITKHVGDLDSANERREQPSPVSVLEPLFPDDDNSPTSIKFQCVETPMQLLQIHFDEHIFSATNQEFSTRASMEDEESAFEYVEAVLLASDLNWEEFLLRWLSSDQILDASLFHEVELFSNRSCHDQKLLFDCTNEVLEELCERYFGYSPWVSFIKHNIRPIPRTKDLIQEVWDGVEWHLLPQPFPCTLDQIVRKDMAKTGMWMDLRYSVESIGIEIGEAIFEELVEDAILSFGNDN